MSQRIVVEAQKHLQVALKRLVFEIQSLNRDTVGSVASIVWVMETYYMQC